MARPSRIRSSASAPNGRARTFTIIGSNGAPHNVAVDAEWVVPTGGGYFFSPSISTIANVLGRARTT